MGCNVTFHNFILIKLLTSFLLLGYCMAAESLIPTFKETLMEEVKTTIEKGMYYVRDCLDTIILQSDAQLLLALQESQRHTVSISRVSKGDYEQLLQTLGLKLESIDYDIESTTRHIYPFCWINDCTENTQKGKYLAWLQRNIDVVIQRI